MTRVVYIVGKGRSGSTLLDQMLGSVPGWFSTGELFRLWDWGLRDGVPCGCGRPLELCVVWSAVLDRIDDRYLDADRVLGWRSHALTWRHAPSVIRGRIDDDARRWCRVMTETYGAISSVTGARVLVDSSKWPASPGAHGLIDEVEPSVVHLVRDPRAVAHSWRRQKSFEYLQRDMPRFSPATSAISWDGRNALALLSRRTAGAPWVTVRYEDLVSRPDAVIADIIATASDEPGPGVPRFAAGPVALGEHHMLGGNPSKGANRVLHLRPDDGWRQELGSGQGLLTTALCLPLLRRFGYPVRWRRGRIDSSSV